VAKKSPLETDVQRLKAKITKQREADGGDDAREKLRVLLKHLKRAQRKRRRLLIRKQHAAGKKDEKAGATA